LDWLKSEGKTSTSSLDVYARKASASPAVGKKKKHDEEQAGLLNDIFS